MRPNTATDDLAVARALAQLEEAPASPVWFLTVYTLLGLAIGGFWWWVAVLLSG